MRLAARCLFVSFGQLVVGAKHQRILYNSILKHYYKATTRSKTTATTATTTTATTAGNDDVDANDVSSSAALSTRMHNAYAYLVETVCEIREQLARSSPLSLHIDLQAYTSSYVAKLFSEYQAHLMASSFNLRSLTSIKWLQNSSTSNVVVPQEASTEQQQQPKPIINLRNAANEPAPKLVPKDEEKPTRALTSTKSALVKSASIPLIRATPPASASIEEKVVHMCEAIERASSLLVKSTFIAELFKLLYADSDSCHRFQQVLTNSSSNSKSKSVVPYLLKLRASEPICSEKRLVGYINQCLALLGHVDPTGVKHRHVNILSLDGGGSHQNIVLQFEFFERSFIILVAIKLIKKVPKDLWPSRCSRSYRNTAAASRYTRYSTTFAASRRAVCSRVCLVHSSVLSVSTYYFCCDKHELTQSNLKQKASTNCHWTSARRSTRSSCARYFAEIERPASATCSDRTPTTTLRYGRPCSSKQIPICHKERHIILLAMMILF